MARKRKTSSYTIGVYGSGPSNRRAISRLMPQRTTDHDEFTMVFLVDALWNDPIDNVLTWAEENATNVLVVVDPEDDFIEDIKDSEIIEIIEAGESEQLDKFVEALGDEGELIILWDEEDEDNQEPIQEVVTVVVEEGFKVYDLSFGMREVSTSEDGADDESAVDEAEEEEAKEQQSEVMAALMACTTPKAAEQFLTKDIERDDVVEICEEMGIEVKPRVRQTTLASAIVEKMEEDGAFDDEKSEEPEKKASKKASSKKPSRSKKPEPEEDSEDEEDEPASTVAPLALDGPVTININLTIEGAAAEALLALVDLIESEAR